MTAQDLSFFIPIDVNTKFFFEYTGNSEYGPTMNISKFCRRTDQTAFRDEQLCKINVQIFLILIDSFPARYSWFLRHFEKDGHEIVYNTTKNTTLLFCALGPFALLSGKKISDIHVHYTNRGESRGIFSPLGVFRFLQYRKKFQVINNTFRCPNNRQEKVHTELNDFYDLD